MTENPIAQGKKQPKGKNRFIKYDDIWTDKNLEAADKEARKGKSSTYGVRKFDKHYKENFDKLKEKLKTRTFKTGKVTFEKRRCDHKVRTLSKVEYRNHIAHHALMRLIMPTLEKSYYYESAASIKDRGIHYAAKHVRKFLDLNSNKVIYWSELDFVKCYHNIVREKLFNRLCKEFKDEGIRYLLHDVIWALGNHNGLGPSDGTRGVGIGLYPIQPLVNFYFNDLDRLVSRIKGVRLFRYCDNFLLVGFNVKSVQKAIDTIIDYATNIMDQPIHMNIGIQKLTYRNPIDFVGYKFYIDHTLIRDDIKFNFKRKFNNSYGERRKAILASYKGWLQHCNGLHLWQTVTSMRKFSDLNIDQEIDIGVDSDGNPYFKAEWVSIDSIINRPLIVLNYQSNCTTSMGKGKTWILFIENNEKKKLCTGSKRLTKILDLVREKNGFPFEAKITRHYSEDGYTIYDFVDNE